MNPIVRIHAADNVVIARRQLLGGTLIAEENVTVAGLVPPGHKVATHAIAAGQAVRRYNQIIGTATQGIQPGQHVHTHNLAFSHFERVHESGVPWQDDSGKRLRDWTGLGEAAFYDPKKVALVPMGFCYPGTGKTGDLPPRVRRSGRSSRSCGAATPTRSGWPSAWRRPRRPADGATPRSQTRCARSSRTTPADPSRGTRRCARSATWA